MVQQVTELAAFNELIKGGQVVVVDFTATWCGPCQRIGPIFVKLAEENSNNANMVFIKVDVDEASDISEKVGISASMCCAVD